MRVVKLDKIVWDCVLDVLRDPDVFMRETHKRFQDRSQKHILDGLQNYVKTIELKEANVRKAIQIWSGEGMEALVADLKNLRNQKQKAQEDIMRIERDQAEWEASYSRMKEVSTWIQTMENPEDTLPYQFKRAVLYALSIKVVVYPDGSDPRYTVMAGAHAEMMLASGSTGAHSVHTFHPCGYTHPPH